MSVVAMQYEWERLFNLCSTLKDTQYSQSLTTQEKKELHLAHLRVMAASKQLAARIHEAKRATQ